MSLKNSETSTRAETSAQVSQISAAEVSLLVQILAIALVHQSWLYLFSFATAPSSVCLQ